MSDSAEVTQQEAPRITTVTSENFDAYVNQELGTLETAAQEAEAQGAAVEVKEAVEEHVEEVDHPDKSKKEKLNNRFRELTKARKEAEAKALAAETTANAERQARETIERERNELKNKYEPPKPDTIEPEPLPSQFTDVDEYAKALKEWAADNTRREDAKAASEARQAAEHANVVKAWNERQEAIKTTIHDYAEKIASSPVKVSDQMREAILESDIGPEILYHLASNPDIADKLGAMPVGKMLREFGKLESSLGSAEKPQNKSAQTSVAEISKAPAPISPLKGANAPAATKVDANGAFYGTYEEFKAARKSGKIR